MLTKEARLKGTLISNEKRRKKAVENYYLNPNYCKNCKLLITIREGEKIANVRNKLFCNRSCSATFNNEKRFGVKIKKRSKTSLDKKENLYVKWKSIKKKDLFIKCKNYHSARCTITKYANRIMNLLNIEKKCKVCNYNKHVEVCHLKAVSDFNDESTLFDMNQENNLIYLCPNCHWEYDNNLLNLNL